MINELFSDIVLLTIIAGRKQRSELTAALSESGGRIINVMYGKGSVKANILMESFGLAPEENKVLITCLLKNDRSDDMLEMLIERFDFNKPNTGIAFTIPLEKLSF